ncbi:MAG: DUF190 domain-containing protein [Ignavibacteriaceae bacterium]|jgi:PII-like signaling protein
MIEVQIFLDEGDLYKEQPMHEYIMRHLMHHNINGASMFAAVEGYGNKHHLHRPGRIGNVDEGPIMILFIDEEEKINPVLPHLKEVVNEGLIIKKKVERV